MTGNSWRPERSRYFMINVTLAPEDDEFLRWFGNQTRKLGGYHMPKTLILRVMTRILKELVDAERIDLRGIFTERQLLERLLAGLKPTHRP